MMDLLMQLPPADVIAAFRLSNFAGQVIVVVLVAGSVLAWTIMITKYRELHRAAAASHRFFSAYRREADPLGLFVRGVRFKDCPAHAVYENGCRGLNPQAEGRPHGDTAAPAIKRTEGLVLSPLQISLLRTAAERTLSEEAHRLESSMGLLATSSTAAPLLGLLGTVWGVMDSFGALLGSGVAVLSAVAPGISGALLTTVVGLLVAIPSTIVYNFLVARIRALCVEMESFTEEFIAAVEFRYLRQD